jgi:hypothetical protein
MSADTRRVAARLGLDEATIAWLEVRGHLITLAVAEHELRERLYRAHLAHLDKRADYVRRTRGSAQAIDA